MAVAQCGRPRLSLYPRLGIACKPFAPWAVYALLFAAHVWFRSLGDDFLPWRSLRAAERTAFFGVIPSEALQTAGRQALAIDFAAFALHISWFLVPIIAGVAITVRRRDLLTEYFGWLLVTFFIADIFFLLIPVEPPWMDGSASRILFQRQFINYTESDNNPVASLPSLHAALPLVIAQFLHWRGASRWGFLLVAYSAAVGAAVVYLGEHWVIDVLAGYALAGFTAFLFLHPWPRGAARRIPGDPVGALERLNGRMFPSQAADRNRDGEEIPLERAA